jgi:hypothetical protein
MLHFGHIVLINIKIFTMENYDISVNPAVDLLTIVDDNCPPHVT